MKWGHNVTVVRFYFISARAAHCFCDSSSASSCNIIFLFLLKSVDFGGKHFTLSVSFCCFNLPRAFARGQNYLLASLQSTLAVTNCLSSSPVGYLSVFIVWCPQRASLYDLVIFPGLSCYLGSTVELLLVLGFSS